MRREADSLRLFVELDQQAVRELKGNLHLSDSVELDPGLLEKICVEMIAAYGVDLGRGDISERVEMIWQICRVGTTDNLPVTMEMASFLSCNGIDLSDQRALDVLARWSGSHRRFIEGLREAVHNTHSSKLRVWVLINAATSALTATLRENLNTDERRRTTLSESAKASQLKQPL